MRDDGHGGGRGQPDRLEALFNYCCCLLPICNNARLPRRSAAPAAGKAPRPDKPGNGTGYTFPFTYSLPA